MSHYSLFDMLRTVLFAILLSTQYAGAFASFSPISDATSKLSELSRNKRQPVLHARTSGGQQRVIEINVEDGGEQGSQQLQTSSSSRKGTVLTVALASLLSVVLASKGGILPVPTGFDYTDALIAQDLGATLLGGVLGYVFVKFVTYSASHGYLEPRDSRKLVHTCAAPLFILTWPLFTPAGRFFAACIPLVNAVRLYLAANGDSESDLANALSRTGDSKEAMGGPFLYVIILLSAIALFWRDNMIGVTALSTMAAGDGMADIVGRRLGQNNKWFFSESKSMAGSAAFWVASTICTLALSAWLSATGCLTLPSSYGMLMLALRVAALTGACAMIELYPHGDDNLTVPVSAAILAALFLQS